MAKALDQSTLPAPDMERFRLRSYIERIAAEGHVEVRDEHLDLIELARHLDGNEKAVWFKNAGPEGAELVGNVMASRDRLAAAFETTPEELLDLVLHRLRTPQSCIEVSRGEAPVQQVVMTGEDADITKLPVHFQHGLDGGPYVSASVDYAIDPETKLINSGCRRLMLRGRFETGIDLVAPSDLKAIYEASARRGERLPVSFTVGANPIDHVAATMRVPGDELELVAALRGEPLAVVKSITNDIPVPADAEMVIEGYLDERGHVEAEGPYGEFLGYYGVVKRNPVFHLTAITRRHDALFQTSTIGGKYLSRTDTAQLGTLRSEATVRRALDSAVREVVAVCATPSSGGSFNVRVALRQRVPGEARNAIAAVFGCLANVKNVFIVDDDIDVFSNEMMDWALATRFQPHRDLTVQSGFRTLPLDPSLDAGPPVGSKAGYDLTLPFGRKGELRFQVPAPPELGPARFQTVRNALGDGPKNFGELISGLGSRDGREIAVALDEIRQEGRLTRDENGAYLLTEQASGGAG